jgi:hypothetical protein
MYSLLKEAGIRSVYTIITAGYDRGYLITDLPCSQFNHAILFVPALKDTIWLECTNQTMPAGYLGEGTDNRFAIAVDENGGKLVHTPKYGLNENLEIRHIEASVDESGNLDAKISTDYQAVQQDELHGIINGLSKDKLMEYLKENIELATYDVKNFNYVQQKTRIPMIKESLEIVADNYASVSGKRLFVMPNILTRSPVKLKKVEKRKFDLLLSLEFRDVDTVVINLPKGYVPEAMPEEVTLLTKFGKYHSVVKMQGDKIVYYRLFEKYSGRFPAADYASLVSFHDAVYKADRSRVVLVKKEAN